MGKTYPIRTYVSRRLERPGGSWQLAVMTRKSTSGAAKGGARASKDDWVSAALKALVGKGVGAVLVLPLAKSLKVARSSFYWHFKNRDDLLRHLLEHWRNTNTRAIVAHAARPAGSIVQGVLNVFECWLDESLFDPRLDLAVRNWARQSAAVRRMVERADDERLQAIKAMYEVHGFSGEDAFIRARVLYYMQIGYYVLDVKETLGERLSHSPAYLRSFTGQDATAAELRRFRRAATRTGHHGASNR